jgi:hypothetical protein
MHDKPDGNPSGLPFVFFQKRAGRFFDIQDGIPDPVFFRFSQKPAASPASGHNGAVRLIPFSLKSSCPAVFVHKTVSPAYLSPLLFSPVRKKNDGMFVFLPRFCFADQAICPDVFAGPRR